MKVECELVERVSKKSGNPYVALAIVFEFPNGKQYEKLVFLDRAEMAMLESHA